MAVNKVNEDEVECPSVPNQPALTRTRVVHWGFSGETISSDCLPESVWKLLCETPVDSDGFLTLESCISRKTKDLHSPLYHDQDDDNLTAIDDVLVTLEHLHEQRKIPATDKEIAQAKAISFLWCARLTSASSSAIIHHDPQERVREEEDNPRAPGESSIPPDEEHQVQHAVCGIKTPGLYRDLSLPEQLCLARGCVRGILREPGVGGVVAQDEDESEVAFRVILEDVRAFDGALVLAVRQGWIALVDIVIQSGANVHLTLRFIDDPKGDEEAWLYYWCHLYNRRYYDQDRLELPEVTCSLLLSAIRTGNTKIVQLLLDAGADSGSLDDATGTIFEHKEFEKSEYLGRLLPRDHTKCRGSPLFVAARFGHQEMVQFLLDSDVVHCSLNVAGMSRSALPLTQDELSILEISGTPLFAAACLGNIEIVRLLIAKGVSLENTGFHRDSSNEEKEGVCKVVRDEYRQSHSKRCHSTPLCIAIKSGHTEIAQLLIKAGAVCDCKNSEGQSPLFLAAASGNAEVVKALVDAGAIANCGLADWRLPCPCNPFVDEQVPSRHKPGKNSLSNEEVELRWDWATSRGTPLFMAALRGRTDIMKHLIANGADVDCESNRIEFHRDVIEGTVLFIVATLPYRTSMGCVHLREEKNRLDSLPQADEEEYKIIDRGDYDGTGPLVCGRRKLEPRVKERRIRHAQACAAEYGVWCSKFELVLQTLVDGGTDLNANGFYGYHLDDISDSQYGRGCHSREYDPPFCTSCDRRILCKKGLEELEFYRWSPLTPVPWTKSDFLACPEATCIVGSPVFVAAAVGNEKCIDALCRAGAATDILGVMEERLSETRQGRGAIHATPVGVAEHKGFWEIARALNKFGILHSHCRIECLPGEVAEREVKRAELETAVLYSARDFRHQSRELVMNSRENTNRHPDVVPSCGHNFYFQPSLLHKKTTRRYPQHGKKRKCAAARNRRRKMNYRRAKANCASPAFDERSTRPAADACDEAGAEADDYHDDCTRGRQQHDLQKNGRGRKEDATNRKENAARHARCSLFYSRSRKSKARVHNKPFLRDEDEVEVLLLRNWRLKDEGACS